MALRLTDSGDLYRANGRFHTYSESSERDQVAGQRIGVRLRWYKGEWPIDTRKGFDWDRFMAKGTTDGERRGLLIEHISKTPGVTSIEGLTFTRIAATRTMAITGSVRMVNATETIDFQVEVDT